MDNFKFNFINYKYKKELKEWIIVSEVLTLVEELELKLELKLKVVIFFISLKVSFNTCMKLSTSFLL